MQRPPAASDSHLSKRAPRKGRHLLLAAVIATGMAIGVVPLVTAQSCDPTYPDICVPYGTSPCDLPPWYSLECCDPYGSIDPGYFPPGTQAPVYCEDWWIE
jgi:hypothetical protein